MLRAMQYTLLAGALGLSACSQSGDEIVDRAMADVDLAADADLSDVMLTVADPSEAVSYFSRGLETNPGRIDLQRGLAISLVRAGRAAEGVTAWQTVLAHPEATNEDRVSLAGALIRADRWEDAGATLDAIPPTYETFERYRLEAIIADSREDWARADSFYETAAGLTTTPASVLNNWGFSKLSRGDFRAAEGLFEDALRHDPQLFTAKNNLVMARGAQHNYELPVIPMTQVERAELLYTAALTAIKQNDINIGKQLLAEAIDTHPQHFEEAVRALRALEENVAL
ncbi:tetratricopeptide repeat protein [Pseudoroseicyclus sp. CXY001]|uniref:tetratricopeptide repeat protein n=1 Tax=Pseudoroseicyclus sp. CXY001 TaxID=3242492 RepID=UPI003571125D